MQHQVAAVVVAMAEHAGLGGQFLDDRRELLAERRARRRRRRRAAVGLEEVLHEEVQLPGELVDVERDAVGHVAGAASSRAAALQRFDEARRPGGRARRARPGVAAPRCACSVTSPRSCSAMMPSSFEWARMRGTGTGIAASRPATLTNGELLEVDRSRVHGQHLRGVVRHQHAEVAAIRRVAGERHHGRAALREPARRRGRLIDAGADVGHGRRHVVLRVCGLRPAPRKSGYRQLADGGLARQRGSPSSRRMIWPRPRRARRDRARRP